MKEMERIPATLGQSPDAAAGTPSGLGRDDVSPSATKRSNASPITALTCGYDSPLGHMTQRGVVSAGQSGNGAGVRALCCTRGDIVPSQPARRSRGRIRALSQRGRDPLHLLHGDASARPVLPCGSMESRRRVEF